MNSDWLIVNRKLGRLLPIPINQYPLIFSLANQLHYQRYQTSIPLWQHGDEIDFCKRGRVSLLRFVLPRQFSFSEQHAVQFAVKQIRNAGIAAYFVVSTVVGFYLHVFAYRFFARVVQHALVLLVW